MIKIEIRCPTCSKKGTLEISEAVMKNVTRGLLAVNVAETVCSHSFIAYIDKNLKIRDYFIADFKIQLPQMDIKKELEETKLLDFNDIDVDLIRINLLPLTLTFIIRSCFLKKKIVILNNKEFLNRHLYNFFNFIFQNSFDINISITTKGEYKINKKNYQNCIVLDSKNIVRDKEKIIDPKKLKIERNIVLKFFTDFELNPTLILLKNEIQKAYLLSKSISEFVKNLKKEEKINIVRIINNLKTIYKIQKIPIPYINFLIEIVKYYFEIDVPVIYDSLLGFI